MMFRELANCPFKAHPASKWLKNLIPSLCDSKTKECGKASKGIEFLIKKNKNKKHKRQTLWFPRYSFYSTSVNREYTHYRVIASFCCKTLNLAPREASKVSLIFWDGPHSMETFPTGPLPLSEMVCALSVECLSLKDPLAFWDGPYTLWNVFLSRPH